MSKERFRLKSAVYLIPRRGNSVLMSLRKNTGWKDGRYSLIAGHIDGGETAEEAVIRETKEESGVDLKKDNLKFVHAMHRLSNEAGEEYIDLFFECSNWDGEFSNTEPDKCGGLFWFDIDKLPKETLDYVKDVISMSSQKAYFSSRREES